MSLNLPCKTSISRALTKPALHIALILLTGILAYSNTFHVPFLFDDNRVILDNYQIKNLRNLWPPSGTRWFGSLTFALNYAVGGLQVTGYHIVNLAIHLGASLLVYRLVVLVFRTPLFVADGQAMEYDQAKTYAPLIAAFLFVSHPIQTQAVTYIAQRYASLATLLFLAATVCYAQARLIYLYGESTPGKRIRVTVFWCAGALVWTALAMKTKEIAITLPIVIALYEYTFFPGRQLKERLCFLLPVALTLFIIPFTLSSFGSDGVSVVSTASDISRHDYLLTQFRVIVTYLRLLVLPINQMIDYVYPLQKEFSNPSVFLSFGLLSTLFLASLWLLLRGRCGRISPRLCIAGFGGLWFFITLSVESSVIPITDVIFEHRLYLPTVGAFMAAAVVASMVAESIGTRFPRSVAAIYVIVTCILLTLPIATHFRNKVWRSGRTLWEDVAGKSPDNARAQVILGLEYVGGVDIDKAIERFQAALRIKPDYNDAIVSLGNAYLEKGRHEEGYQLYLKALVMGNMDFESRAMLLMNIGNYKFRVGDIDGAIYYFQQALATLPNEGLIHFNLGQAYKKKGLTAEAAKASARAKQLNPDRY